VGAPEAAEKAPAKHEEQLWDPEFGWNLPALHGEHRIAAMEGANRPSGHESQARLAEDAWNVPAGQAVHSVDPAAAEYLPVEQLTHEALPVYCWEVPWAQDLQLEEADNAAYMPASHEVQLVDIAGDHVPALHLIQVPLSLLYSPASHTVSTQALAPRVEVKPKAQAKQAGAAPVE